MVNSLDLSAHAAEITSTHQRILASDSSISWAVYGFDRGGTTLNVQATGSDGLEELAEEFDDGKVQFAFARVQDPNTQLAKFVFISWCGQGVPVFRKGMVSSQVGEVQQVLGGSHVTVIARSAEDVLPEEIMDKVERSSGAQYSYHTQPKRQPPAPAAKPAFNNAGGQAFRKGATYGAPSVGKGAAWTAAAATPPPVASKPVVSKPATSPAVGGYSKPSYAASPAASLGGTKPLFSGAGRPVSSFFSGARSPTTPSASLSPGIHQQTVRPSPPISPAPEPARTTAAAPPPSAYRSQRDERQAELEALRRGSRGTSPSGVSRAETPTSSSSRFGAGTPAGEPSANFSQADQTKSELELLRSRRLLNTNLGGSSGPSAAKSEVDERKAELEALRRGRGGSQSSMGSQQAPPTHSWSQSQVSKKQDDENDRMRQQQQEDEQRRRREQEENDRRRQQEEEDRRRQQQQQQQREEEERKRRQQQQREQEEREAEDERRRQLQQQESAQVTGASATTSSRGQRARAVYDYDAEADDELPFREGDIIYNVDQLDPGWWAGETEDGSRQGVFPANFVELINDEQAPKAAPAAPLPPRAVPAPPPAAPAPPPMAPAPPPAAPAPPPMAPAPPPMAPAPPPVAPPPPPVAPAPPAPQLPPVPPPVSWSPPAAPAPPPMAPPMPPALPPRGGASESEAPALPPRGGPPPAPPAPPAPPVSSSAAPALPPRNAPAAPAAPPPPPPPPPAPAAPQQQDFGQNYAIAVYEYEAAEEGELSFSEGERITHIEFPSSEWWEGVNEKGEYGLFPANYVELESH
ncbi:actin binding protein [Coemansia sp. RSA 2603]|nr:actin binding protein [Coemansia sp. RSA 2603]